MVTWMLTISAARLRSLGVALAVALLASAAVALASTALTPAGCVADADNNPDGCAQTAVGLYQAGSVAVSPDGKSVYATSVPDSTIVHFDRDTTTGAVTPKDCITYRLGGFHHCAQETDGLFEVGSVAVSPDGASLYATSLAGAIVRFQRDTTTGALTPAGCIRAPGAGYGCVKIASGLYGADSVAVSADGTSVYAVSASDNAIVRFKRNTTTGALTPKGCIADPADNPNPCPETMAGLDHAASVAVSSDGMSVYVAGYDDNAIVRFKRNTTSGALTPKDCTADSGHNPDGCAETTPGLRGAKSVTVSPDGKSVYAAGFRDNAIVRLDRDATSGALTPAGCIGDVDDNPDGCPQTAGGLFHAESVAVSENGDSVYVAASADNAIVSFDRNTSSGALTPAGCIGDARHNSDCAQTTLGLRGATSVAVSADGKSVYTAAFRDSAIALFGAPGSDPAYAGAEPGRIDAGFYHTCGIRSDGTLACWGDDSAGQSTPPTGSFSSLGVWRIPQLRGQGGKPEGRLLGR
jgi:DNA-binding beta-propeller fold protein YncE